MTKAPQEIKFPEQGESRKNYSPAYFLSIELENVLCFKTRQKLDLSDTNGFPAQWTIILGDNGVGKTTLLRSLAGMEPTSGKFPSNSIPDIFFSAPRFSGNTGLEEKQLFITPETKIKTHFVSGAKLRNWTEASITFTIEPSKSLQRYSFAILNSPFGTVGTLENENLLGLKCYGYGANRRMGETSLSETLSSDGCTSLFSDNVSLINAEEWLLQADYAVSRSAPDNKPQRERRFYLIQDILKKLLPDVSDIRITLTENHNPRPAVEFLTPYGWVPLKSLSLGYKTVIAWTVDLAARMIERYPNSADPLAEPAVVLVDEIDLHLHPKWQRTIMSFLTERFPNTQFIVTAHSPLVVQAAKNANIVLLRREGDHVVIDNDPEIIDNWRVEQVLSSVFELPSPHAPDIAPLIERRRKLLAKSKLTAKDERELKTLEAQIGTIPTAESPEDIRAMDIIRKAAKLLENS
jgi:energy-coupling factor transporter ATP-binding protein EcfA2